MTTAEQRDGSPTAPGVHLLLGLRLAAAAVCLGRAWSWAINGDGFGVEHFPLHAWPAWARLADVAGAVVLLLAAGCCALPLPWLRRAWPLLLAATVVLLGYSLGNGHRWGSSLIAVCQWSMPALLGWLACGASVVQTRRLLPLLFGLLSLCFLTHGLFALDGFLHRPNTYAWLVGNAVGLDQPEHIDLFLNLAGGLDLLVAIGLWWAPTRLPALVWALAWGSATTLARWAAPIGADLGAAQILGHWTAEVLFRLPHAVLPALLLGQHLAQRPARGGHSGGAMAHRGALVPAWAGPRVLALLLLVAALAGQERPTFAALAGTHALSDQDGRTVRLAEVAGTSATVVLWFNDQCVYVKRYLQRGVLVDVPARWQARGVRFLAVHSSWFSSVAHNAKAAAAHGLAFPILDDHDGALARAWGATRTPEVYVFGSDGVLAYHGAIDDDVLGQRPEAPIDHLEQALTAVVAGQPPEQATSRIIGCPIKWDAIYRSREGKAQVGPGIPLPDWALRNADGSMVTADAYAGTMLGLVCVDATCPHVARLVDSGALAQLAGALRQAGGELILIDSSVAAGASSSWHVPAEAGRLLLDPGGVLAQALGASLSGECYLAGADGRVFYHGPVDSDVFASGRNVVAYASAAVAAHAAGGAPDPAERRPYGTPLRWPELGCAADPSVTPAVQATP